MDTERKRVLFEACANLAELCGAVQETYGLTSRDVLACLGIVQTEWAKSMTMTRKDYLALLDAQRDQAERGLE